MKVIDGWLDGAKRVPTNKYTKGVKITPRFMVWHHTAGWTTEGDVYTLTKAEKQVSCQLILGRDGVLIQTMPLTNRAWHAGPSKWGAYTDLNGHAIGLEICNIGYLKIIDRDNLIFEDLYGNRVEQRSDGVYVGGKRRNVAPLDTWPIYNNPITGSKLMAWEPFYQPQFATLDKMTPALIEAFPTLKEFVTHEQIDKRGWKTDVSRHFPMYRYRDMLLRKQDVAVKQVPYEVKFIPQPATSTVMVTEPPPVAKTVTEAPPVPKSVTPQPIPVTEARPTPWYKRYNIFWR